MGAAHLVIFVKPRICYSNVHINAVVYKMLGHEWFCLESANVEAADYEPFLANGK